MAANAYLAREHMGDFVALALSEEGVGISEHAMHRLIQDAVRLAIETKKNLVIVAPPEQGKTAQISKILVWFLGHNNRLRVALVSRDEGRAKKNLIAIRKTILSQTVKVVFPNMEPDYKMSRSRGEWSMERIYLRKQSDPCFEANSLDSISEGSRYDIVWLDDAVTRKCHRSEAERELVNSAIFNTWMRRITEGGIVIVTNNKWHRDDAISQMTASESYFTLEIGYEGTERIYWKVYHPPVGWKHGSCGYMKLWDKWPRERLAAAMGESRTAYKRLFEQKTVIREEMRFPEAEAWATYEPSELPEPTDRYGFYAFMDPAGGKHTKHEDYAALFGVMIDEKLDLLVTDCWIQRVSPEQQVDACFNLYARWTQRGYRMNRMFIEMLPKDEMWLFPIFQRRAKELRQQGERAYDMPFVVTHPVEHKNTRIERIIAHFEHGWLRFPVGFHRRAETNVAASDSWARLIGQIEDFPFGDHDDGPDALAGAVVAAQRAGAPAAREMNEMQRARFLVGAGASADRANILRRPIYGPDGRIMSNQSKGLRGLL